jgi:hypothetical protein
VGFAMYKMALGQVFSESLLVPCQYHSTAVPYALMYLSPGDGLGLLVTAVPQKHGLTPS